MFRSPGVASMMAICILATGAGSAGASDALGSTAATPDASPSEAVEPASAPALVDLTPRWSARSSLADGTYRSAFSRGKLDLGVKFDTPARTLRPGDAPVDPVVAYVPPVPVLSVGLRSTPAGTVATTGSLLERATGATLDQPPERKVGVEWRPAKSRVFLNRGVGIRLGEDDRVTMRLKKGSLGIFMQSTF